MRTQLACLGILVLSVACGGDDGGDGDGDGDGDIPEFTVSGAIVDFETGEPLTTGATVTTSGLTPAPTISVTGADFTIEGIPPFSVFHILASSPPTHRATYNRATQVDEQDITGAEAEVLSETYLATLISEFGVTPAQGTGVLVAQLVDESGEPAAGIPSSAFVVNDASPLAGPFFLDADRQPDPAANATSTSGYVVFFDLEAGVVAVTAAEGSGITLSMPTAPSAPATATLATIDATNGEIVVPTGVSFADDVVPIFDTRGCNICHSGNGIGRDLGNLTLDGSVNLMYRELTEEISPNYGVVRVDGENPDMSVFLTLPSFENPPDSHPNTTFAKADDPDRLTILGWLREGAQDN